MRINSACAKNGLIVSKPSTVANYFMEKLRHRRKECVIIACLDGKGQMIREDNAAANKTWIYTYDNYGNILAYVGRYIIPAAVCKTC